MSQNCQGKCGDKKKKDVRWGKLRYWSNQNPTIYFKINISTKCVIGIETNINITECRTRSNYIPQQWQFNSVEKEELFSVGVLAHLDIPLKKKSLSSHFIPYINTNCIGLKFLEENLDHCLNSKTFLGSTYLQVVREKNYFHF